jgi:hypothetical protein
MYVVLFHAITHSRFPHQTPVCISPLPHRCYTYIPHQDSSNVCWEAQITNQPPDQTAMSNREVFLYRKHCPVMMIKVKTKNSECCCVRCDAV